MSTSVGHDWNFTLLHEAVEQAMNTIGAARGLPALSWALCEDGMLLGWAGYSSGTGDSLDEQLAVITPWLHALDLTIAPTHTNAYERHIRHRWYGEIDGWRIRIAAKEPRATEVS